MDRRQFIGRASAGALAGVMTRNVPAPPAVAAARAARGQRKAKPLSFDPRRLRGLSERLIVSHHENNYGGAVRNLAKVEDELSRLTAETPGFMVSSLRERELTFANSVILHELYFENLGGDGKAAGTIAQALSGAFDTFARWEASFRAGGASLAGGSGWVVLALDLHGGDLRLCASGSHSQALAFGAPLLVMDMYEHAYHIDYGAAAGRYIDAFFQNIDWGVVDRRLERARKAAAALSVDRLSHGPRGEGRACPAAGQVPSFPSSRSTRR